MNVAASLMGVKSKALDLLRAVLLTLTPVGAMKLTVLVIAAAPLAKLAIGEKVTMPVVAS